MFMAVSGRLSSQIKPARLAAHSAKSVWLRAMTSSMPATTSTIPSFPAYLSSDRHFRADGFGHAFQPILISGDNWPYSYAKPQIVRSAGHILLLIPATESGSGYFNREILYVRTKDGWHDLDVTSWLDELRHRSARRASRGEGAYPGLCGDEAGVETPLWHEEDGGSCPKGGLAEISLQWRGDRLAVRDVRFAKAGECGQPLPQRKSPGR